MRFAMLVADSAEIEENLDVRADLSQSPVRAGMGGRTATRLLTAPEFDLHLLKIAVVAEEATRLFLRED